MERIKMNGRKRTRSLRDAAMQRKLTRYRRILRQHLPELQERYGVKSLGVFGSYVHGNARPRSDLDLLVELEQHRLTLLGFIGLENYLSDLLGVKVDLVEKATLKPHVGHRVLKEVVPV